MPGFELFGDEERKEVNDVLETGVLFRYGFDPVRQGHWKARLFEDLLAKRLGVAYCHLCASGTAALSTALASCGIGAGDEVIVPPFTFIATIETVLAVGAVPVFAEIDETLCLDPQALKVAITSRTRAILPVHMCGSMARIDEILQICELHNLILIEDVCQSLGGSFNGKALGTFGKAGCFSFDPVKTVTCGEGGAIVTDDSIIYTHADAYTDHGHDHKGNDRGLEAHLILGTNYRISELNAAVGVAQLRKLDMMIAKQLQTKKTIKEALSQSDKIRFRHIPDPDGDTATFLSFFLPDESTAQTTVKKLGEAGVDGCFNWYANNWHYISHWDHLKQWCTAAKLPSQLVEHCPDYQNFKLLQSDDIMRRTISMQIKLSWTEDQIEQRIAKMMNII